MDDAVARLEAEAKAQAEADQATYEDAVKAEPATMVPPAVRNFRRDSLFSDFISDLLRRHRHRHLPTRP